MRGADASLKPQESAWSPKKESSDVNTQTRRGGDEEEITNSEADLVEQVPDEEKLKVVVRVRPLQKSEEPWSTASGTSQSDDDSNVIPGRKGNQVGARSASASAISSAESALSLHEKSVLWEKNGQIKTLLADAVFSGEATQDDVFYSVEDSIDGLLAGFDCSVFAYGQTGTGKTHTMSGLPHRGEVFEVDDSDDGSFTMSENFGVVPRCIQRLFDQIDTLASNEGSNVSFSVYCSFVEIYNERIYDILSSDVGAPALNTSAQRIDTRAGWNRPQPIKEAPSLQIRQKLDGTVFVDGLTSRRVSSRAEMLRAFREGSMNREVRDNLYNQHSSRGHSIFQVTLRKNVVGTTIAPLKLSNSTTSPKRPLSTSANVENSGSTNSRLSRLFLVDLAGSEKWHVNGSDLNDRYATELSSINKSLSALTNCVLALTQKERPHVPYRDSVLTRLLQSCLQGHGRTSFIVTISPARESLEESFATLRFAERLKALRCRPIRRKILSNEPLMGEQRVYYENQIQSMRMEVNRLRELLKKAHRRNQEIADTSAAAANAALVEENRRLKELLMHSERNRLAERGDRLSGKLSKGAPVVASVDPSPQRQAARQIIASAQRPVTEEVPAAKTISPGDMDRDTGSSQILPSTPQPQPRPKPSRKDDHGHNDGEPPISTEEKEYSTLVNRLQDKEARLNWMLEAELEAQNTRGNRPPAIANGDASGRQNAESSTEQTRVAKSTATRSWAVERVLRKNLVVVPPPLRAGSTAAVSDHATLRVLDRKEPVNPHPPRTLPSPSDAESMVSPRQRQAKAQAAQGDTMKHDSPRYPSTTASATSNSSKNSALNRPTPRASKPDETSTVKSASLLKLVGSSETKGKSKDELVDDYKRARRAELEAMLRTMVQKP